MHQPSRSRDKTLRTLGSTSRGSVRARRAASSADCRLHLAADRWCSSADKAAKTVWNVAAMAFFFLFVAVKKKKNKG